jgi:hypothetical protein
MDLSEIGWGVGGDSSGSGKWPMAGSGGHGDETSGSGAMRLVNNNYSHPLVMRHRRAENRMLKT